VRPKGAFALFVSSVVKNKAWPEDERCIEDERDFEQSVRDYCANRISNALRSALFNRKGRKGALRHADLCIELTYSLQRNII
jgi:hypothetical protein